MKPVRAVMWISMLLAGLDGYPAVISRLSCSYAGYRMSDCEISIETKTL